MILVTVLMMLGSPGERANLVDMIEAPSERLNPPVLFAPGAPPTLGFRYLFARDHGRAGDFGLMADDAGH